MSGRAARAARAHYVHAHIEGRTFRYSHRRLSRRVHRARRNAGQRP